MENAVNNPDTQHIDNVWPTAPQCRFWDQDRKQAELCPLATRCESLVPPYSLCARRGYRVRASVVFSVMSIPVVVARGRQAWRAASSALSISVATATFAARASGA